MPPHTEPQTILFLAANPKDTERLRLDQELRDISQGLERARKRDQFNLEQRLAVRPLDIRRAMLDVSPQIIHFSGHGGGEKGLVFEDESGKAKLVGGDALAGLFELFADRITCVVLNGCYSKVQAEAIAKHIPYVIGMNQAIGDKAAIAFAVGFYDALGAGRSIEFAYKLGCAAIRMEGSAEHLTPELVRGGAVADSSDRVTFPASNPPGSGGRQANPKRERNEEQMGNAQVFISYRTQDPDRSLAQEFYAAIQAAGYSTFMAGESIRLGEDWAQRIDAELARCDYFLLLLSERSAVSEMVTEEVRRAKQLRDQTGKPLILPIRINFPISAPLNYDLRGYLQRIQQREWHTAEDTPVILEEILALLSEGTVSQPVSVPEEGDPPAISEVFAQQESIEMPPLPVAEPELPGGQVDLASQFYVERGKIEAQCYEAIATSGALIRVKAPRQMGKTSLMSRILRYAEQQGCLGVPLSFQVADSVVFADLDRFLRWFAASVTRRLKLANRLNEYWDEVFGSKDNCTAYFEEYLLPTLDKPLALCLDEVDMVFQHLTIAADFFGLLRNWHEMGKTSELWKRFRLVVVHSTEVYIPMNINQSPFNVGLPIELPEFTAEQVQDLAARHGLRWNTSQIGRLMSMVGGHPYLVRLALYHIARGNTTLEVLLREAPTEAGLYGDHLRRHLWNLEQHPELANAVRQLVATQDVVRLPSVQAFQLHSMGLVDLQGNDVMFRSELYRTYFADRLGARR